MRYSYQLPTPICLHLALGSIVLIDAVGLDELLKKRLVFAAKQRRTDRVGKHIETLVFFPLLASDRSHMGRSVLAKAELEGIKEWMGGR